MADTFLRLIPGDPTYVPSVSARERAQKIVRQLAEQEKYDLIVQDAVCFSAKVDITEKVLRALNNGK